jgi:hypothetical protein
MQPGVRLRRVVVPRRRPQVLAQGAVVQEQPREPLPHEARVTGVDVSPVLRLVLVARLLERMHRLHCCEHRGERRSALGEAERGGRRLEPAGRRLVVERRRGGGRERAQLGLSRQARLGLEPRALPLRRVAEVRRDLGALRAPAAGRERVGARLVRDRVDAHLGQPLLQVRVPVVLDLVVGALGEVRRDGGPPACTTEISAPIETERESGPVQRGLHK